MQAARPIRHESDLGLNMVIVLALTAANGVLFIVLPLWLLPASPLFAWLAVPLVLVTVTHWATIHEAIHGNLHPERPRNDRLGRLLAILFGAPFEVLRFGHLSHHALNGSEPERPDLFDPGSARAWLTRPVYYLRLLIGLYAAELASALACLLPRRLLRPLVRRAFYEGDPAARAMSERAVRQLLEPGRLAATRRDAVLILLLFGGAFWLYGGHWHILALALLGRAFVVSFMDNAPHYGGETDEWSQGYDMKVPDPLGGLILNSNLHGTHHRHPNVPWRALPRVFATEGTAYAGNYLTIPWRQLRGPIPSPRKESTEKMLAS
jgi:fatty acid desaturase